MSYGNLTIKVQAIDLEWDLQFEESGETVSISHTSFPTIKTNSTIKIDVTDPFSVKVVDEDGTEHKVTYIYSDSNGTITDASKLSFNMLTIYNSPSVQEYIDDLNCLECNVISGETGDVSVNNIRSDESGFYEKGATLTTMGSYEFEFTRAKMTGSFTVKVEIA